MLKDAFFNVYTKFKLHFYQEIFSRFQDREASLTTVETFCCLLYTSWCSGGWGCPTTRCALT